MDLAAMQVLMNGGPTAIGAYVITFVTKKWIPARFRSIFALGVGFVGYVAYNAMAGSVPWPDAIATGLGGGFAASGFHEVISKGLKGK